MEEVEKVQDLVKPLLINNRRDNGLELLGGKKCLECILCYVNQQHASSGEEQPLIAL